MVLCYASGHGVHDKEQYFMLNAATNNRFGLEAYTRAIAKSQNFCHLISLYDLTKNEVPQTGGRGGDPAIGMGADKGCNYVEISSAKNAGEATNTLLQPFFDHLIQKS